MFQTETSEAALEKDDREEKTKKRKEKTKQKGKKKLPR